MVEQADAGGIDEDWTGSVWGRIQKLDAGGSPCHVGLKSAELEHELRQIMCPYRNVTTFEARRTRDRGFVRICRMMLNLQ